jgi:hypothetical protein
MREIAYIAAQREQRNANDTAADAAAAATTAREAAK